MRTEILILTVAFLAGGLTVGCDGGAAGPSTDAHPVDDAGNAADVHAHEGDDVLFWQREGIEAHGYELQLGHHGISVLAGHRLEPAISIIRGGEPVADAQVFNSLVSKDGQQSLAAEVATVYEPTTAEEPAHYAQGGLDVPEEIDRVTIRYRIVLPGGAGEVTYDVSVVVEDH